MKSIIFYDERNTSAVVVGILITLIARGDDPRRNGSHFLLLRYLECIGRPNGLEKSSSSSNVDEDVRE